MVFIFVFFVVKKHDKKSQIMTVQSISQEMGDWNAGEQSKCDSCMLWFSLL